MVNDAAAAINFYKAAFGAKERMCLHGTDGVSILNAELLIGGSLILVSDAMPALGVFAPTPFIGSPCSLHLYVEDVDQQWAKALEAGALPVAEIQDTYWGDRSGEVADPFGYRWSLASRVEKVSEGEIAKRIAALASPPIPEVEETQQADAA